MEKPSKTRFLQAGRISAGIIVLTFGAIPAAHAYIDPGTGSMILQLFAASVAATLFYLRHWRVQLMSWFSNLKLPGKRPTRKVDQEHQP